MGSLMRESADGPTRYVTRPELRAISFALNVPNMPQTTNYSAVSRMGDFVAIEAQWKITAAPSAAFWMDLPYQARAVIADLPTVIGTVSARRTGVTYAVGNVVLRTSTTASFATDTNAIWSSTSPYAFATNDDFWVSIQYFATP